MACFLLTPQLGATIIQAQPGDAPARPAGLWSDSAIGEILCEGAVAPCFMIRRGRYKYIYSAADPEQLYDLEADPHELRNPAAEPESEEVRRSFNDEVMDRWDTQAIHREVLASQRRRRLVAKALTAGARTSWDHQPFQDASQRYMRNHIELEDLERRALSPARDPSAGRPGDNPGVTALPNDGWQFRRAPGLPTLFTGC